MVDAFFFHLLGVLSLTGIVISVRTAIRNMKKAHRKNNIASVLLGIFYFISAYGAFIAFNSMENPIYVYFMDSTQSIIFRLYIFSIALTGMIFLLAKAAAIVLKKQALGSAPLYIAQLLNMIMIFYPILFTWLPV